MNVAFGIFFTAFVVFRTICTGALSSDRGGETDDKFLLLGWFVKGGGLRDTDRSLWQKSGHSGRRASYKPAARPPPPPPRAGCASSIRAPGD